MLEFDHLTVIAPTLEQGVDHIRTSLDVDIGYGGKHPEMGTHNHILRLSAGTYLEVIALDPDAPAPPRARWFGLDDLETVRTDWQSGRRLRGWVTRTENLDQVLSRHGGLLGAKMAIGKIAHISVPKKGCLPLNGALPSVIDRAGHPPRSTRMPENGIRLESFLLEHPTPEEITALYEEIGIHNAPRVKKGKILRYAATIKTPNGSKTLY